MRLTEQEATDRARANGHGATSFLPVTDAPNERRVIQRCPVCPWTTEGERLDDGTIDVWYDSGLLLYPCP